MELQALSPLLTDAICRYILKYGRDQEGIFRVSPSRTYLTALRKQLTTEGERFFIKELQDDSKTLDSCAVASLLKSLLSEFSTPLLSPLLYNAAGEKNGHFELELLDLENSAFHEGLREKFLALPYPDRTIAASILSMLHELLQYSGMTKMEAGQLSIVFAPVLFGCPEDHQSLKRFDKVTSLLQRIITNPHYILDPSQTFSVGNDEAWLCVVRFVVHERFFPQSTGADAELNESHNLERDLTIQDMPNKGTTTKEVLQIESFVTPATSGFVGQANHVSSDSDLVSTLPFTLSLPVTTISSNRSVQLTRIAEILCERFGINSMERRRNALSPVEEKLALQRALLQLEGSFGRPVDKVERQIVRPLYERYRELKRLTAGVGGTKSSHHGHHHHHQHSDYHQQPQRRLKHQAAASAIPNSGAEGLDARWATPSSSRFYSAPVRTTDVKQTDDGADVIDLDQDYLLTKQHLRHEKRRSRNNSGSKRSDLNLSVDPSCDSLLSTVDDYGRELSNLSDIKQQLTLNSASR